jgi:hypothetical protein
MQARALPRFMHPRDIVSRSVGHDSSERQPETALRRPRQAAEGTRVRRCFFEACDWTVVGPKGPRQRLRVRLPCGD